MQEIQVGSPSWEDPLEKEMATHSSILAWKVPWTEEPGGLQSMESQRVKHDLVTKPPPDPACGLSYFRSDSLRPHGLQPARLLCPWDFPGKNTRMGCHVLLRGIFPTQGSNPPRS